MIVIFNRVHPEWSSKEISFLFSSDKKWSSKKKKKAYSQDQAMIFQTSKNTFKRQALRSLKLNKSRKFPKSNQHKIRLGNGGATDESRKIIKVVH